MLKGFVHTRFFVWGFASYICLLLYQTNYKNLGTTLALLSIGITLVGLTFNYKAQIKKLESFSYPLLAFVFLVLIVMLINGYAPHYLSRFLAQIVLFLFLCKNALTCEENELLKALYCVVMSIYAGLTIYSVVINPVSLNYIHGDVLLFNTQLDPNYLSIPFVASINILIYNVLRGRYFLRSSLMLIINLMAVLCLASRGAMVALVASTAINVCFNKGIKFGNVIMIIGISSILYYYFGDFVATSYSENIERMIGFGADDDSGRFDLWVYALDSWRKAPLFGIGLGGVMRGIGHASHNFYVELISETGLVGFTLFALFLMRILKSAFKYDKMLFVALFGILVQSLFVDVLADRTLWVFLIWCSMLSPISNGLIEVSQYER